MNQTAVSVRDAFCVHHSRHGAVVALRGLSIEVTLGEIVVVHGPNGAGKTTLLHLLAGQQTLTAGQVMVHGAEAIGWVDQQPQRALRPELTVRQNVALQSLLAGVDPATAHGAAQSVLEALGLAALAERDPQTLSGGQAQRVAVCAAIAHRPTLILADEPCGELDRENADLVYETLRVAARLAGAAVVLVSHDLRAGRIADRVLRIRDGRLSESAVPGGPDQAVVDGRGWMRLPEQAQRLLGPDRQVGVAVSEGVIVLDPRMGVPPPAAVQSVKRPAGRTRPVRPAGEGLVRAEGLTKSYPGRQPIVTTLGVEAGELVTVSGRSGSGKSTILAMVTGMLGPDAGRLRWQGQDIAGWTRQTRAETRSRLMAVVGQPVVLIEAADLVDNLIWARSLRGLSADRDLVDEVVEVLGLERLTRRPVETLSGGERQRVGLARGLVAEVPLLVLDEPTSQLDEARAAEVVALLRERVEGGLAVLAASHDPVLLAASTRHLVLEDEGDGSDDQAACGRGNS